MSADIHLVVGSTGAGKSTFARALARRVGGVCFLVDEWMQKLFFPERPENAGFDWYAPRVARCAELISALAEDLVRAGTPSVLEIGLTQRRARAAFYERAAAAHLRVQLHTLDAPAELRWQRVQARNQDQATNTTTLQVTREMFDFVERMWEPPIQT